MTSYSSIFSEIFKDDSINTAFIHFFDNEAGKLSNDFMPVEVTTNSTDISVLQALNTTSSNRIIELETKVQELEAYILDLKDFMNTFRNAVYVQDISTGSEYAYDGLL